MKIVIGSRGSQLALAQSEQVKACFKKHFPQLEVEIKVIQTKGDRILDKPLHQIGDKGLFTQEIEEQLLDGRIDLAVHSMKDMPGNLPKGLMFAGTLPPADARDCLIFNHGYQSLEDLPFGAVVGTGSPRRKAQLLRLRPDLKVVGIRGNVQTRLAKMQAEQMDATILACAGLERLKIQGLALQPLSYQEMVPACAQGILALEVKEDSWILPLIAQFEDAQGNQRMKYERLFLMSLGGSCHLPIGAHVTLLDQGIRLDAVYGTEDGRFVVTRHEQINADIEANIQRIALEMKAEVENYG